MRLIIRLTSVAIAALICTAPAAAKTWRKVVAREIFAPRQEPVAITEDGVTVTVTPGPADDESDAVVVVQFPGVAPYRVPRDEDRKSIYGLTVGIGRMAADDSVPTVLLGGYTGGAHCCATLQVISLIDGRPISEMLPMTDGDALDRFPRDIDGDGTSDIRWNDDSLLYQFASHAGSWQVPRIYNIVGGKSVVVSREPRYARIFRDFAKKALRSCRRNTTPENGDCAAYAYAMAILGRPEEGIRTADSLVRAPVPLWLPEDCEGGFDEEGNCPEGKLITFDAFEPALRYLMRKNGYLP
jgi:hypothetical protein